MFAIKNNQLERDGSVVDQIPSPYKSGAFAKAPKIVVMHFTGGGTGRSSAEWFRSPQNPGSSAHVVIDRDGSVIQCVPFNRIAWHAGRSEWHGLIGLNQHSIGIEMANWGNLKSAGDGWASFTGVRIAQPVVAPHRNGNPDGSSRAIGWEPYSGDQFDAAVGLVRALVGAIGINEIVGHDDIAPTRKWDPGPAFDMARFRTACLGGREDNGDNVVTVKAKGGLNLRAGPGVQFASLETLKNGAVLRPTGAEGRWMEVSVLGANKQPRATGWVHSAFVG
jgi:N-acetylmuramoyl-L-alanine amidase